MRPNQKKGYSFLDDSLSFSGLFHDTQPLEKSKIPQENAKSTVYGRFQRSIERKITHIKKTLQTGEDSRVKVTTNQHQYDYRQFANEPKIQFSPVSLLILTPVLLCVNLSIVVRENISPIHFVFLSMFVCFVFNLIVIIRKNRIMPFLPTKQADDRLKLTALIFIVAVGFAIHFGWSASGGMIFAVIWQSLAGRQGCFFLIIFGAVVVGTITMELSTPQVYFFKLISSILFGITGSMIKTLEKNNVYAIANELSLFLMIGSVVMFAFQEVHSISLWQHFVIMILGFSVYFNLLMAIKLMQTQRISTAMGIISGIIIISATQFIGTSNYVAGLTIILSILVLIKIEYIDKEENQ